MTKKRKKKRKERKRNNQWVDKKTLLAHWVICYKNSVYVNPKDTATRNFVQKMDVIVIRDISGTLMCVLASVTLHSFVTSNIQVKMLRNKLFLKSPLQFTPALAAPRPPPRPMQRTDFKRLGEKSSSRKIK